MELLNLTPHDIKIIKTSGLEISIPRSGKFCRLREVEGREKKSIIIRDQGEVCVVAPPKYDGLIDLPSIDNQPIIVSMLVGEWIRRNPEYYGGSVYGPDTGKDGVVRDSNGRIVGTKRLICYKE